MRFTAFGFSAYLALTVWAQTASASTCALTAADLAARRHSRAALASHAQIDAVPQDRQTMLCATRLHWNRIAAGNGGKDEWTEVYSCYLSPRERRAYNKIVDAFIRAQNKRPDGEWGPISQQTLEMLNKLRTPDEVAPRCERARHPEVRAKRASKGDGPGLHPSKRG